jgi:hypothetical protein
MSFNQKIISVLTVFAVGITVAIAFVLFEPPYEWKFWLALGALLFSEVLFGAFWVQQIAKADSVLPMSIGVWGINAAYFGFTLLATLLTGMGDKYFILLHVVGFALFTMAHLFFRMVEHHIEEQSKDEEPEQKIERAKVTWR